MNQVERPQQFDIEGLRRQVSEIQTRARADGETVETTLHPITRRIAEQFREESYSPTMVVGLIRLMDFAVILAIGYAIVFAYLGPTFSELAPYLMLLASGGVIAGFAMQAADCYQPPVLRSALRGIPRAAISWVISFSVVALALVFLKQSQEFSRVVLASWAIAVFAFLVLSRFGIAFAIRRWARNGVMERRAVVVGGGESAKALIRKLEEQPDNDIRICGIFDDRNARRSPDIVAGYPKLGTFAELVEFARIARIDMLLISLPLTAEQRIIQLMKKLWVLPVDVRIAAHSEKLRFRPRTYSHVGAVPMLDVFDKPITDWDSVAKRGFDLFFATIAILLLWPVMIAAAIAVKSTSKGPVIFVQKRHGFNNEIINVFKFRSMYTEMSDPTARQAVTKGDPRVTPVGRFLRKSSIDELPQLFNVLTGGLSLVGPRPHAVAAQSADRKYADVVESYFARHKVKPGVTGWAQINGWRGEIDNDDKIKYRTAYDLHYIENWSLWFDLKILFLTPIRLLNTENAY